jgi:hypothetical protein
MALLDTGAAIGRVTALLRDLLDAATAVHTTVGRPEPGTGGAIAPGPRLNLFLYEAQHDASLRNHPLEEGGTQPLWLVLKYLVTPFDTGGESDTMAALDNLGVALRALQALNYVDPSTSLSAAIRDALGDNPEPLKITFDDAPADLLSKLMQGPDSKYRFSMAFQVRPVLVAGGGLPAYALPVGVDSTAPPPGIRADLGIHIPVLPSLGPRIDSVSPAAVEPGGTLEVRGAELHLDGLSVRLGAATLPVVMQRPDVLRARVDPLPGLEAGGQPVAVVQALPFGRTRASNLLVATLVPRVDAASASAVHAVGAKAAGTVQVSGALLGRAQDDVYLALHRDGRVAAVFEGPFTFGAGQASLSFTVPDADAVAPGAYRVIVRVNGAQARRSPEVSLVP